MNAPEGLKRILKGAVSDAVALAIVSFTLGGCRLQR